MLRFFVRIGRLGCILCLLPLWPFLAAYVRRKFALGEVPPGIPPQRKAIPRRQPPRDIAVLIVSWNGKHLLEVCLPALRKALDRIEGKHQIIVVDNGSDDRTVGWLNEEWPEVEVVPLDRNCGFGEANNIGFERVGRSHVLLLNNDMVVEEDFLEPLLRGFDREDVFAVSSQIVQEEGVRREETGLTGGAFRGGEIHYFHDEVDPEAKDADENPAPIPILWAGGGASLYDMEKVRILGGFDPLFFPAYCEDTDLSWRAWKLGWRSLLAPDSLVLHRHRSTSSRVFSKHYLQTLVRANQWTFLLRNLTDGELLALVQKRLFVNFARSILHDGIWVTLRACKWVLNRAPRIRETRGLSPMFNRIPDQGILSLDRRFVAVQEDARDLPRVLLVSAFVPRFGFHAGAQRIYQLIKRLSRRWRISVLAFAETQEEADAAEQLDFCEEVEVLIRGQSPGEPNPFGVEPPSIVHEYGNPKMREAIRRKLTSARYDLVQFEYLQMAYLFPEGCSVPSILTDHEVQCFNFERQIKKSKGLAKLAAYSSWMKMLRFELRACRRFDRIVTMTKEDAAALLAYDPELPIVVNNTGVDVLELRPSPEPEENRLCFVGYYRHRPNLDAMVHFVNKVLPLIRKKVPDVTMSIIGASPPPELEALREVPGVEVTGRVPSIAPEVQRAKVYVVPLREGAGIRGKILEAWALGRAVVSTTVGCAGIAAQDGEHLRIADEDEDFAEAVIQLLQDDSLRQRIRKNALSLVTREYSWEAKALEHHRLWASLFEECGCVGSVRPWRRNPEVQWCSA